jgi:hypothetical protein
VVQLTVVDDLGGSAHDTITLDVAVPEEEDENGSGCKAGRDGSILVLLLLLCTALLFLLATHSARTRSAGRR